MADIKGFLKHQRELPSRRPVQIRLMDWNEVHEDFSDEKLQQQASRCMDCGIPFCNNGCPLGNIIPDWNDLVYRDRWEDAIERLHATNNFPEFTGRLCPAPCEGACVLGINQDPVAIKQVEVAIIDKAWNLGWVKPILPTTKSGKSAAVVGSGPAGLAAAQQLTRAGHDVTVFERADRIGGLLRYGIPEFKMEKQQIDRRVNQMEVEGTIFRTNTDIGTDIGVETLMEDFDAVVLAGGATRARDLPIPGRELVGIYQAMEYLPWANRAQMGDMSVDDVPVNAKDKKVVIIGGGDTGADCLGTAHRQGAAEIQQFEIMPQPPQDRSVSNPWPTFPMTYKVTPAHQEGGERLYSVHTEKFLGDDEGNLRGLAAHEVEMVEGKFQKIENSDFEIEADLVFLAMGFTGPEDNGLFSQVGISLDDRSNVVRNASYETNVNNIWVCGDMGRGQSLIVWAIAEGRSCAAAVDLALSGSSTLPIAIQPTDRPLS